MTQQVIHGDCLKELKNLPDNSVDLVCTDPPYGYSFMGKDWDKAVPSVEIWKECLRVLKPGAFAFVMSAPRQDVLSQMIVRIGEAGFDTDFTSIYWTYASGFPKAHNIGKSVDKRVGVESTVIGANPNKRNAHKQSGMGFDAAVGKGKLSSMNLTTATSKEAKALDGSYGGFQPKPAVEVIIVAMKPLSEKTFVDQALKNGKGITWLDDCRVPTVENTERPPSITDWEGGYAGGHLKNGGHEAGRFPANLLVSDDVLNDGVERKVSGAAKNGRVNMSGKDYSSPDNVFGGGIGKKTGTLHNDSGSYSRYFDLDAWAKTLPFLITPKASKGEKNEGLDGEAKLVQRYSATGQGSTPQQTPRKPVLEKNHHPTVKPLKLMSYLITLGSREGDVVLEPFMGSGTTCLAAKNLKRGYIGIEREKEYVEIAQARLKEAAGTLF